MELDALDFAVLEAVHERPRAGVLELSRSLKIARATVQARMKKLEDCGVVAGYEPRLDVEAAGFGVQAFVTLEIAQGALDSVTDELSSIPGVLEAFATTGAGDVLCRIAAASHMGLQHVLLELNRSGVVVRSTSVVVLSVLIPYRSMPLLRTLDTGKGAKSPAYRGAHPPVRG
ncbi:winged helix-turn-helix transcriptional regulator [Rhodococcus sp. Eu-32]|uniref:Lrp/AsnC family transcriptional regulator n=1 Tax=Rhodococcus sp. Eu-32 TaxID=1017319 RepID=UPI000DF45733|nr:Lrp/AsnC ligand binding domain-containing protein [Rhodococcus sp. Eu-32]RRQ25107.1 winged helix-turn-helix transcriptional regulator [Rhodococcus sp. Eu-32]